MMDCGNTIVDGFPLKNNTRMNRQRWWVTTRPKFNMALEHWCLEEYILSFWDVFFEERFLLNFRGVSCCFMDPDSFVSTVWSHKFVGSLFSRFFGKSLNVRNQHVFAFFQDWIDLTCFGLHVEIYEIYRYIELLLVVYIEIHWTFILQNWSES